MNAGPSAAACNEAAAVLIFILERIAREDAELSAVA